MKYGIEVLNHIGTPEEVWVAVRATPEKGYWCKTKKEAEEMAKMWYGYTGEEKIVRIVTKNE